MTATINAMDYVHVDNLLVDQLMVDDLVEIDDEIVQILNIVSTKDGFALTFENEFGEKNIQEFKDNTVFKLFILQ